MRPLAKVVPSAGDDFRINQVCRKQIDLPEIRARHQARLRIIAFHLGVQPYGEKITMSAFERLLAIADEETLDLARAMIGKPELALLLAKEALDIALHRQCAVDRAALGRRPDLISWKVVAMKLGWTNPLVFVRLYVPLIGRSGVLFTAKWRSSV